MSEAAVCAGHTFRNPELLELALTHASCSGTADNERLEFLGDAVLSMLISWQLCENFPGMAEGPMTKARALVVNTHSLARKAVQLGLAQRLKTGRMFRDPSEYSEAMLADAFEALLGAVFLDAGIDAARTLVRAHFTHEIETAAALPEGTDWKSRLHQWSQAQRSGAVSYRLLSSAGEDHCRTFEVCVLLGDQSFAAGYGRSRKEAEQHAAHHALAALGQE